LVADDDMHLFPVWYLQQVENYRTDVVIVSRSSFYKQWYYDALKAKSLPQFTVPAFTPSEVSKNVEAARTFLDRKMFQFIAQNIQQRPCYYYHKYPLRIKPELSITRVGLLYKLTTQPLPGTYQHPREFMLNSVAGEADDYLELQYPYLPPPNGYTFRLGNQSVEVRDFWREWAAQRLSDSYLLEALWHQQNEKPDLAERDFIQSLELNPFNYRAHYYRGKLYLGQGKTDAAGNAFIQSAFINGNFQPALEAIEKMKAMTTDAPK
jgi:tetratricopeptide (TPR) repeat protein